jgi:hypothetical protein
VEGGRAACEELGEALCGFGLHAGEHVLVGRHREAGCGVAEPFADDLDRHSGFEQQSRVRVTETADAAERLGCTTHLSGRRRPIRRAGGDQVFHTAGWARHHGLVRR